MAEGERRSQRPRIVSAGWAGPIWFMGWLFTVGYANLVWWQIILGLIVWPYFLGLAVR